MIKSDEIPLAPLDPPQLVEVRVHGVEEENYHLKKKNIQKCRKIRGLGCVNQACTRARVKQPSPHIFLHICSKGGYLDFIA